MPTTSTHTSNELRQPMVSLTYYAAGRHQVISFATSNPDFRSAVQALHEQRRPFRIIYH